MVIVPLPETLRALARQRQLAAALLGGLVATTAGAAYAHGRPPSLNQVVFDEGDPNRIVAQATWGAVVSEDGGESWRWLCAASMGVMPRNQDPRMAIVSDGRLLVATFDGLVRSDPALCDYERPDPMLADAFVIDVAAVAGSPESVYALRTSSLDPDQLFVSDDGGASFTPIGPPVAETLLDRLRVAPSDPDRLYLSGAAPRSATEPPTGFVVVSDDGGESLSLRPFAFEGDEWNVLLLAVDPTDAGRLLVHAVHFEGEEVPERVVLSEDGGESWTTVARVPQVGGAAFSDDGRTVLLGSRLGGLFRSDDGGRTFAEIDPDLKVRCIARRGAEVFLCTDPGETRVALLRSTDGGARFETALHFDQIEALPECAGCSDVGIVCPAWFVDVAYDLGLDAEIPDGAIDPDAGTGLPRDVGVPEECRDAGATMEAGMDATMDGGVDADDPRVARGGGGCSGAGRAPRGGAGWLALAFLLPRRRSRCGA